MIAPAIVMQAAQFRRAREGDSALFHQLAPQRIAERLAALHAAARQIPAGDIGMPHEKHAPVSVDHRRSNPQRHRAAQQADALDDAFHQARAQGGAMRGGGHGPVNFLERF